MHKIMDGNTAVATQDDVTLAYKLVLGRAPDEKGLAYFASLAESQKLSPHEIARLLINSEEFKSKNGGLHDPVEIALDGYSVYVRGSDRDIGGAIAKGISYEPHVTALLKRELKSGNTFLDVGANIGYFTMLATHLVGASGKVIAIEPMDKNVQLIYLGIEKNKFNNVEVFPIGASSHNGIVSIVTDPNTSNALVQSVSSNKSISTFASVRTLDWMCQGIDRLDFMKMDIEGHEVFAWRGAADTLARFKPRIATEFHPYAMKENSGLDYDEYLQMMLAYSSSIDVIVSPEKLVSCDTKEAVMEQWLLSDKRHGGNGTSHLDLFLRPRD
ncbi:FkbM family methyltransferase [Dokdonella sp.]|uniref:FkbM family methyltransferase n=1 Tax=Dokdonella sp. TaxID=2291710 RepID=UPI003528AE0A